MSAYDRAVKKYTYGLTGGDRALRASMGGTPPIGYRPDGRSLAIVEEDAAIVRHIFQRYLDLGTVRALYDELIGKGIRQPRRTTSAGRSFGGTSFGRAQLYNLLKNPLYVGRIKHGSKTYPGNHPAIVDRDTWDRVQAQLADNSQGVQLAPTTKDPSLLAGKVVDQDGEPLVATHACKGKVRYRYYVSRHLQHGSPANDASAKGANGVRIPAKDLEQLVVLAITRELRDPIAVARRLGTSTDCPRQATALVKNAEAMVAALDAKRGLPVQTLLGRIVQCVTVQEDVVELALDPAPLCGELGLDSSTVTADAFRIMIPARIRRTGLAVRFVLETGQHASEGPVDQKLVAAIVKGRTWWKQLQVDPSLTVTGLAAIEGANPSFVDRILRLAFLSPVVIESILSGEAPAELNLHWLKDVKRIAPSWAKQQQLLGVAASRG